MQRFGEKLQILIFIVILAYFSTFNNIHKFCGKSMLIFCRIITVMLHNSQILLFTGFYSPFFKIKSTELIKSSITDKEVSSTTATEPETVPVDDDFWMILTHGAGNFKNPESSENSRQI